MISLPKYASQLGNRGCWLFHFKHLLKLQELHIKIYKSIKIGACGWNAMHFVLLIIWGDWISLEPNPPSCSTYISDGQLRKEAKQSITFEVALCETTPGSNISRCFLQISFTIWCTLKPAFQRAGLVLFKCFMEYSTKNTSASHVKKYSKYNFVFGALKRQLTNALFCVYSKCDPNE